MEKEQSFNYKKWLKNRDRTIKVFFFINFALGIEFSLTFATLFVYLKGFLKNTNHLNAFYSGISGIYILSTIISSIVVGKIFDKTRQTRLIFCVITALVSLGNVLYTIPISPWLLFFGRVLSGLGGSMRPIIVSELTRSFPPDQVIPQMTAVACAIILGYTVGPCINLAFVRADFWFLGVHIKYGNGASLVSCFIYILTFFVCLFYVSDLSRDFDLKEALKDYSEEDLEKASLSFEKQSSDTETETAEKSIVDRDHGAESHVETTPMLNQSTGPSTCEGKDT